MAKFRVLSSKHEIMEEEREEEGGWWYLCGKLTEAGKP